MSPTRRNTAKRRLSDAQQEFLIKKVMDLERTTEILAGRIRAFDEETSDVVYEDARAQLYNEPDKYPCQYPVDEAEFHKYWPVFDEMLAGADKTETLFDAYVHQFFFFGAAHFINAVYLGEYPNKVVDRVWAEAQKRNDVLEPPQRRNKSGLSVPGAPLPKQKQHAQKRSASAPWTPILSIEMGGDHALINTEVQRRSKSGKMYTYTITRLDRDAHSRRVFVATHADLDVEVVFSEEEMREMVAERQPCNRSATSAPPNAFSESSGSEEEE